MRDIIIVTDADYVDAYTLALTFSDGLRAEVDYSDWIAKDPFCVPLRDLDYFKKFTLDGWTVVWPNGADIAAETLHKIAVKTYQQVRTA
jgi:hypothetical protein